MSRSGRRRGLHSSTDESQSRRGPSFYRGCLRSFCNLELRGIQKNLKEFEAAGVRPVAISVDTPEVSRNLAGKAGYTFPILSDPTAETIGRYDKEAG